jgi:hypothetical protein
MNAASGTAPHRDDSRTWDDLTQPNTLHRPRLPVSRRQIIGHPAGHLKDASGAAYAAGLRPVLDLPARSPQTWQLPGKQETPVTHAHTEPPQLDHPSPGPLDTAPLLQG